MWDRNLIFKKVGKVSVDGSAESALGLTGRLK